MVYAPPLQYIFQTEALSAEDLGMIVLLSSSVFWIDEIVKWWLRRREGARVVPGRTYWRARSQGRSRSGGYAPVATSDDDASVSSEEMR